MGCQLAADGPEKTPNGLIIRWIDPPFFDVLSIHFTFAFQKLFEKIALPLRERTCPKGEADTHDETAIFPHDDFGRDFTDSLKHYGVKELLQFSQFGFELYCEIFKVFHDILHVWKHRSVLGLAGQFCPTENQNFPTIALIFVEIVGRCAESVYAGREVVADARELQSSK